MIAALQTRIAALLGADAAFDGVEIITDDRPDWISTVAQAIGRQDLIVVVGLAEGEGEGDVPVPVFWERVRVLIMQHHLHTDHSAVVLMQAAILALHNMPVTALTPGPEVIRARSHRSSVDEDGVISAEVVVDARIVVRTVES